MEMHKQCPMCAEYLDETDVICKYCGYNFNEPSEETDHITNNPNYKGHTEESIDTSMFMKVATVAGILGLLLILGFVFNTLRSIDNVTDIEVPTKELPKETKSNATLLEEGKKSFENNDYDTAAEKFDLILKSSSSDKKAEANYYMGLIYKSRDLKEPAIQSFKKAFELNPKYKEAKYEIMVANFKEYRYDEALNLFVELLDDGILTKKDVKDYFETLVMNSKDFNNCNTTECLAICNKVNKIDPNNKTVLELLIDYYRSKGDVKNQLEYAYKYLVYVEYDEQNAIQLLRSYYKLEYYSRALEVVNLLESHGYNRKTVEELKYILNQKRDQYNNRNKSKNSNQVNKQNIQNNESTSQNNTEEEYDPYVNIEVRSEGVRYVDRNAW